MALDPTQIRFNPDEFKRAGVDDLVIKMREQEKIAFDFKGLPDTPIAPHIIEKIRMAARARVEKLEKEVEFLTKSIEELRERLEKLRGLASELKRRIEEYRKTLEELKEAKEEVLTLRTREKQLWNLRNRLLEEREQLENQIEQVTKQIENLKNEALKLKNQIEELLRSLGGGSGVQLPTPGGVPKPPVKPQPVPARVPV